MTDPFFEMQYPNSLQPSHVPFTLRKGLPLMLINASITKAKRYSRMLETFLVDHSWNHYQVRAHPLAPSPAR